MTDIVWQSVVIQAISYLLFVFLLGKIFFEPVMRVMEKRNLKVKDLRDSAKSINTKAKEMRSAFEEEIDEAKREAGTTLDRLRNEADKEARRALERSRREVSQMREIASIEIQREKKGLMDKLGPEVEKLAEDMSNRIVNDK